MQLQLEPLIYILIFVWKNAYFCAVQLSDDIVIKEELSQSEGFVFELYIIILILIKI